VCNPATGSTAAPDELGIERALRGGGLKALEKISRKHKDKNEKNLPDWLSGDDMRLEIRPSSALLIADERVETVYQLEI
jgi:hypothetical protein